MKNQQCNRNLDEKQLKLQAFDQCFRYEVERRSGITFDYYTPNKDVCICYEELSRSQKEGIFQCIADKMPSFNRNTAKKFYHQQYRKTLFPHLDCQIKQQICDLVPLYANESHYMQLIKQKLGDKVKNYLPYDINNCINSEKQKYDRQNARKYFCCSNDTASQLYFPYNTASYDSMDADVTQQSFDQKVFPFKAEKVYFTVKNSDNDLLRQLKEILTAQ